MLATSQAGESAGPATIIGMLHSRKARVIASEYGLRERLLTCGTVVRERESSDRWCHRDSAHSFVGTAGHRFPDPSNPPLPCRHIRRLVPIAGRPMEFLHQSAPWRPGQFHVCLEWLTTHRPNSTEMSGWLWSPVPRDLAITQSTFVMFKSPCWSVQALRQPLATVLADLHPGRPSFPLLYLPCQSFPRAAEHRVLPLTF